MFNLHAESLTPPPVRLLPGDAYDARHRLWQGIPGAQFSPGGHLYATWYTGGEIEGPYNHVLLKRSADEGLTWSQLLVAIDPPGLVRAFDPVVWVDPQGRLWLFWAQCFCRELPKWRVWNGLGGVWCIRCDNPDASEAELKWTEPRRISHGIMMNKPIVHSSTGDWLLTTTCWAAIEPRLAELGEEALCRIVASTDHGETFIPRGGADVPDRDIDEPMTIERKDGSLWMLVRAKYGIGQSTSTDAGHTWSPGCPTDIWGPNSRFYIGRLPSGNTLLINHKEMGFPHPARTHLTASLSTDDGATWSAHLLLDERADVSYPDVTLAPDGRIFVIYDRERHGAKEILLAGFTEADIVAGQLNSEKSFLRRIVDKIGG